MSAIILSKYHALGNDYLVLDPNKIQPNPAASALPYARGCRTVTGPARSFSQRSSGGCATGILAQAQTASYMAQSQRKGQSASACSTRMAPRRRKAAMAYGFLQNTY